MLSESQIAVIKSTVPVLEVHGTAITKRFYERLFESHPELLNVFNHANQKQGRQQTALANAVYAAAKHIDKLETILPAVKQIAYKHRSLGVRAEHYPIVGENLLAAIKEVLGSAATDEILEAWADAYGVIADVFIGTETELYARAEHQYGGWEGFRRFTIERKVKESDVITSFYLVPEDGKGIAAFQPGQYIGLKAEIPGETYTHIRQYSLSDSPGKPYYRISVKREDGDANRPAGKVSVFLHTRAQEGDTLWLSAPAGDFILDLEDRRPVVLLSGGVGLTPMISMLNALTEKNDQRQVTFIHAARNGRMHAMKRHVEDVARQNPLTTVNWCYSDPTEEDTGGRAYHRSGHVELPWLRDVIPAGDAVYYFCGPVPFMRSVYKILKDMRVPGENIRYEFFGPAGSLEQPEPIAENG